MTSENEPPQQISSLRLNLDATLIEALGQLRDLSERGTGDLRIDQRIADLFNQSFRDYEVFQAFDAEGEEEAFELGLRLLEDISRVLTNLRPITKGFLSNSSEQQHTIDRLLRLADEVEEDAKSWRQTSIMVRAVAEAQQAASKAVTAASALTTAAGDEGASRLEEAFVAYAKAEQASAESFRFWTIFLLAAVAVLGLLATLFPNFPDANQGLEWRSVVYRVSVLTALAGLAAYLGRQSGQHRRAAAWADAIAVQLRAFPAFIQPIRGEKVADELYEAFGKRVLGSPPDFAGKSDDAMNPTMSALVDALVKQARPTA